MSRHATSSRQNKTCIRPHTAQAPPAHTAPSSSCLLLRPTHRHIVISQLRPQRRQLRLQALKVVQQVQLAVAAAVRHGGWLSTPAGLAQGLAGTPMAAPQVVRAATHLYLLSMQLEKKEQGLRMLLECCGSRAAPAAAASCNTAWRRRAAPATCSTRPEELGGRSWLSNKAAAASTAPRAAGFGVGAPLSGCQQEHSMCGERRVGEEQCAVRRSSPELGAALPLWHRPGRPAKRPCRMSLSAVPLGHCQPMPQVPVCMHNQGNDACTDCSSAHRWYSSPWCRSCCRRRPPLHGSHDGCIRLSGRAINHHDNMHVCCW